MLCWTYVVDVVPTLYKWSTNVLCLLGCHQIIAPKTAGLMSAQRHERRAIIDSIAGPQPQQDGPVLMTLAFSFVTKNSYHV